MAGSIIRMAAIDKMVSDIEYKGQILARTNKIDSAVKGTGALGFAIGCIAALLLVLVPAVVFIAMNLGGI